MENKEHLYVSKSVVVPMADGGLNFTNIFLRWDSRAGFWGRESPSPRWWPRDTQDLILTQGSPAHRKDQCDTRTLLLQPEGTPGYYSYRSPREWGPPSGPLGSALGNTCWPAPCLSSA